MNRYASARIAFLKRTYTEAPRLYTLGELCVTVGGLFIILWVLPFCYWYTLLTAVMAVVCGYVFISSFLVHGDTLKELGIRADNLGQSLKEVSVATALCAALTLYISIFYKESHTPRGLKTIITIFLQYIPFGIIQQFGLNSYLFLRLKKLLGNNSAAIICAVAIFSLLHVPNMHLMLLTSIGGLIYCYLFSRNRNIFSLGVMHGIVGGLALILLVPGFLNNFTVGPSGTERYDAYGNSPLIFSGDVNGDSNDEILISKSPAKENDSEIIVLNRGGAPLDRFDAFDAQSRYGVNLATGDVNGDGVDEIIAARGAWHKNDTFIRVLTASGKELSHFYAFPGKNYGANVAAGDINGDGKDEIIVGMGPGQRYDPVIKVFTEKGKLLLEFMGNDFIENDEYHKKMLHGIQVFSGDIDGDGIDEIVATTPHVRSYRSYFMTFDFDGRTMAPKCSKWFCIYYSKSCVYGSNAAVGDVNGDGIDEIVVAPGPDHRAVAELQVLKKNGARLTKMIPFKTRYGLSITTADINGDGKDEILATPGIGETREYGTVKAFDMTGDEKEINLRPYLK